MKTFFIALFGALVWGIIAVGTILSLGKEEQIVMNPPPAIQAEKNPFLEFYTVENAVAVSPHDIRMEMDKWGKDFIIVDLRSAWEYEKEHIKWAINIPGVAGDTNAEAQEARLVAEFAKLPKDKRIIVHCYTHYCMLAKHVWLMLAKQGIYVHELNVGWNEWRYQWDLWNGEGTSKTVDINNYIEWTEVKISSGTTLSGGLNITPCTADWLAGC